MGGSQSADFLNESQFKGQQFDLKRDIDYVQGVNDDLYGESQLIRMRESIGHPLLILKQSLITSQVDYDEYVKLLQKRKQMRCPYLISLLDIYQVKLDEYCSMHYKLYSFYEFYQNTLFDEMVQFNDNQQHYQQLDILQMIQNVLQALTYLNHNCISHNMIKASTIAITPNLFANKNVEYNDQINSVRFNISSKNKYMIADARFLLNGINGQQQANLGEKQDFYLSPENFAHLKHLQTIERHSQTSQQLEESLKDSVFSLGMVAIEMATLKSVRKVYDFDYQILNKTLLMNKLDQVASIYSPQLAFIIANMLTFNVNERASPQQVLNLIDSFQENPSLLLSHTHFSPLIILTNYKANQQEQKLEQRINFRNIQEDNNIEVLEKLNNNFQAPSLFTFKNTSSIESAADRNLSNIINDDIKYLQAQNKYTTPIKVTSRRHSTISSSNPNQTVTSTVPPSNSLESTYRLQNNILIQKQFDNVQIDKTNDAHDHSYSMNYTSVSDQQNANNCNGYQNQQDNISQTQNIPKDYLNIIRNNMSKEIKIQQESQKQLINQPINTPVTSNNSSKRNKSVCNQYDKSQEKHTTCQNFEKESIKQKEENHFHRNLQHSIQKLEYKINNFDKVINQQNDQISQTNGEDSQGYLIKKFDSILCSSNINEEDNNVIQRNQLTREKSILARSLYEIIQSPSKNQRGVTNDYRYSFI